jgi:hypothetical protein
MVASGGVVRARLELDTSGFNKSWRKEISNIQKEFDTATKTIKNFNKELNNTKGAKVLKEIDNAIDRTVKKSENLNKVIKGIKSTFDSFRVDAGIKNLISGMDQAEKKALQTNRALKSIKSTFDSFRVDAGVRNLISGMDQVEKKALQTNKALKSIKPQFGNYRVDAGIKNLITAMDQVEKKALQTNKALKSIKPQFGNYRVDAGIKNLITAMDQVEKKALQTNKALKSIKPQFGNYRVDAGIKNLITAMDQVEKKALQTNKALKSIKPQFGSFRVDTGIGNMFRQMDKEVAKFNKRLQETRQSATRATGAFKGMKDRLREAASAFNGLNHGKQVLDNISKSGKQAEHQLSAMKKRILEAQSSFAGTGRTFLPAQVTHWQRIQGAANKAGTAIRNVGSRIREAASNMSTFSAGLTGMLGAFGTQEFYNMTVGTANVYEGYRKYWNTVYGSQTAGMFDNTVQMMADKYYVPYSTSARTIQQLGGQSDLSPTQIAELTPYVAAYKNFYKAMKPEYAALAEIEAPQDIAAVFSGNTGEIRASPLAPFLKEIAALPQEKKLKALQDLFKKKGIMEYVTGITEYDKQMNKLNTEFDKLKITVGNELIPTMTWLISSIRSFVQNNPGLSETLLKLGGIVAALAAVGGIGGLALEGLVGLAGGLKFLGNGLLDVVKYLPGGPGVVSAIEGLTVSTLTVVAGSVIVGAAAGYGINKADEGFTSNEMWSKYPNQASFYSGARIGQSIFPLVGNVFKPFTSSMSLFEDLWEGKDVKDAVYDYLMSFGDIIPKSLNIKPLQDEFRKLVLDPIQAAATDFYNYIVEFGEGLLNTGREFYNNIIKTAEGVYNNIIKTGQDIYNYFKSELSPLTTVFGEVWNELGPAVGELVSALQDLYNELRGAFGDVWGALNEVWASLYSVGSELYSAFSEVYTELKGAFGDVWSELSSIGSELYGALQELWNSINPFTEALNPLVGAVDPVTKELEGSKEKISTLKQAAQWLADRIREATPYVKAFATFIREDVVPAIKSFAEKVRWVRDKIQEFRGKIQEAKDKVTGFIDSIKGFADKIRNFRIDSVDIGGMIRSFLSSRIGRLLFPTLSQVTTMVRVAIKQAFGKYTPTNLGRMQGPAGPRGYGLPRGSSYKGMTFQYQDYAGHRTNDVWSQDGTCLTGNCFDMTLGAMGRWGGSMVAGTWNDGPHVWWKAPSGRQYDFARKAIDNTFTPPPRGPSRSGSPKTLRVILNINDIVEEKVLDLQDQDEFILDLNSR